MPSSTAVKKSNSICRFSAVFIALLSIVFLIVARPVIAQNDLSGTLVIVTSFPPALFEKFRTAFEERHPQVKVFVRSKKTSAAISFIEERITEPVDLFWASAPDAFEVLKESGHLRKVLDDESNSDAYIGSYPIDDPDGYYKGFAVSGYGLVWNREYLERNGLSTPQNWKDLTDPAYKRHIGISAPSRSGTTHLIVESILQSQGWTEGWSTLLEIGGNLATITARSFGVIDGIRSDRFGIGAAIDFFGQSAKASGAPVDFTYPDGTAFLPANIAMVKRSVNPEAARAFIEFVLSDTGQMMLFDPQISRLPVMQSVYEHAPPSYPNPFDDELAGKGIAFDTDLSRRRYHLVNSLFDVMITYRLQLLRRTWSAIHEAERMLKGSNDEQLIARLEEARRLASMTPVNSEEASTAEFASLFVRHKPGIPVSFEQKRLESEWAVFARSNQDRAFNIANEVLSKLRDKHKRLKQ